MAFENGCEYSIIRAEKTHFERAHIKISMAIGFSSCDVEPRSILRSHFEMLAEFFLVGRFLRCEISSVLSMPQKAW